MSSDGSSHIANRVLSSPLPPKHGNSDHMSDSTTQITFLWYFFLNTILPSCTSDSLILTFISVLTGPKQKLMVYYCLYRNVLLDISASIMSLRYGLLLQSNPQSCVCLSNNPVYFFWEGTLPWSFASICFFFLPTPSSSAWPLTLLLLSICTVSLLWN